MSNALKNLRVGNQVMNTDTLLSTMQLEIKRLLSIQKSLFDKGLSSTHPLMQSYADMIQKRADIIESLLKAA